MVMKRKFRKVPKTKGGVPKNTSKAQRILKKLKLKSNELEGYTRLVN